MVHAQVGKGYAARTSKAGNKKEAEQLAEEGMETITLVYKKGATALDGLKDMAKQLRRLPTVDLELPTVSPQSSSSQGRRGVCVKEALIPSCNQSRYSKRTLYVAMGR